MTRAGALLFALCVLVHGADGALTLAVHDAAISTASDSFRWTGVNFDFWPTTKAKWDGAGALILDLDNPSLRTLARGLSGSLLRLGGSPADFLLYDVTPDACSAANLNKTQPPGKGYFCPIWDQVVGQCLTLERWQALLTFAGDAGLSLVLDLNACWGRTSPVSDQDWSLIDGLLAATAAARDSWGKGLWGVEYANEVYSNISPAVYGAAAARLRARLDELWPAPAIAPRVMGPDAAEDDLSPSYYTTMLNASRSAATGASAFHAVTFHDYADDCCKPADGNVLNVTCLDAFFAKAAWVRDIAAAHGVATWNGEGALHAYSGVAGLTNTALSTLFYLHALGAYADGGFGLFSRQALVGGDYELVNRSTFAPTPDYWGLLLFRTLVSGTALNVSVIATPHAAASGSVRAHAFCTHGGPPGSVTVLLVNFAAMQGEAVSVAWPSPPDAAARGQLYQLTGVAGWGGADASSDLFRISLNNDTLAMTPEGALPPLPPVAVALAAPAWLPPASATFLVWPAAAAAACMPA